MRRLLITTALLATMLLSAGLARAELAQDGNIRVSFGASFAPHSLPREEAVPLTVHMQSKVRALEGGRPPALRRFVIAINRYGILSTRGLPVCDENQISGTSTAQARAACGSSLVGHGRFTAYLELTQQHRQIPVAGRMLVFNGKSRGKPALLLHIFIANPAIVTFVLTTHITRSSDKTFGTVLSTTVPQIAAGLGYVTNINMTLGRKYRYKGEDRSFLSASCAAPVGFSGAPFSLVRVGFSFVNGQQLGTTLIRNCTVR